MPGPEHLAALRASVARVQVVSLNMVRQVG